MSRQFGIVPVDSLGKALHMLRIRNQVRLDKSNKISLPEQVIWYYAKYKRSDDRAYIVVTSEGLPMGYGLISNRKEEWTVTGAILEDYRRLGMGRHLFRFLTQNALLSSGKDVYLDVKADNLPAIKLCISLGYVPIDVDGDRGIIKMKWSGELISV